MEPTKSPSWRGVSSLFNSNKQLVGYILAPKNNASAWVLVPMIKLVLCSYSENDSKKQNKDEVVQNLPNIFKRLQQPEHHGYVSGGAGVVLISFVPF